MPLIRLANAKLLFFAHVPKCAGTSVEAYLRARFGPLGMLDQWFAARPAQDAWSLSPPQHMPEPVRQDLLPDTLFDAIFATVRHPAIRLRSVFLFQREVEKAIPMKMSFPNWLDTLPRSLATTPYALHGHLRPMSESVPKRAQVFRIEDGLDPLVSWLDDQAGDTDPKCEMGRKNVTADRFDKKLAQNRKPPSIQLDKGVLGQIADIYAADYDRFGYSVSPPSAQDAPSKEKNPS
jgi:hypothetical protein